MAVTSNYYDKNRPLSKAGSQGIGTAATTGNKTSTGYVPGQSVTDAQQAMAAAQAGQPGAYTPGQSVTDAQKKLAEIEAGKPGEYTAGQSVTDAEQKLKDLEAKKPGEYTPGDAVTAAQAALDAINNSKPQGYESKYGAQLDSILQQIQNPQQFKYEFNGDELFKSYADLYTQKGKQASLDAMGQAAGLTGGYGNSYAQQVGNQAYDQYLLSLYDKGMDLRDRAYQQYQDQRADLYNQYNLLGSADDRDYGRYNDDYNRWLSERDYFTGRYDTERGFDYNKYLNDVDRYNTDRGYYTDYYNNERNFDYNKYRDTVGDWEKDRDYYTGRYDTERTFDYDKYNDDYKRWLDNRDYYTGRYDTERGFDYDKYTDQRNFDENQRQFNEQMQENVRQFNENLDWDKMSTEQKQAASWVEQILAMGQMPSAELLAAAGLSEADAQKLMAQIQAGGSGKKKAPKEEDPTNVFYTDKEGNYYYFENGKPKYIPDSYVKDNDMIHNIYDEGAQRRKSNKSTKTTKDDKE
jgi:hypothetical protein